MTFSLILSSKVVEIERGGELDRSTVFVCHRKWNHQIWITICELLLKFNFRKFLSVNKICNLRILSQPVTPPTLPLKNYCHLTLLLRLTLKFNYWKNDLWMIFYKPTKRSTFFIIAFSILKCLEATLKAHFEQL